MNKPKPLSPDELEAVRESGAAWCSEMMFARIFATLDSLNETIERAKKYGCCPDYRHYPNCARGALE